jgi:hypothetical protein
MELTLKTGVQSAPTVESLETAPRYFPLAKGRYEVKPGLARLGTDYGNGQMDQQVFQIDDSFAHYWQMKRQARAESWPKYFQLHQFGDDVARAIAQFVVHRLVAEHPHQFQLEPHANGLTLYNQRTQETLGFDPSYRLQAVDSPHAVVYQCALDALAHQVQEDLTVVSRQEHQHWMSAIHLCFPNHWSAIEKIGQRFEVVHAPVAGMAAMNQRSDAIVHTMITGSPAVRFAWGVSTDTRLNHHPEPPPGIAIADWVGRAFDPTCPQVYLRIERQVVWGFPAVNAALFTIRTYFRDCAGLKQDARLRSLLCAALRSMSPESLVYKGLAHQQAAILHWLEEV